MYFAKNMEALARERRSAAVYEALQQCGLPEHLALFETDAGDYTLQYNGVFLHMAQGAQLEARQICSNTEQFHPGLRSNHLMLGIGLGYLLDEAFQHSSGRIFIYEPHLPLLRFTFENVDLSDYISSQRVYFAHTMQDLFSQLRSRYIIGEPVDVITTRGYATLLAPDIPTLMNKLLTAVEEQKANIGVGLAYHMDWVQYFLQNVPHLAQAQAFESLLGHFQGKAALIISSGPSLDNALPFIKQYRDHYVVVSVGSALRALLEAGIEPDFAVFLDFQGPREQLTGLAGSTENISFLLSPFADTYCFEVPAKARYIVPLQNYEAFSNWLEEACETQYKRIGSGSTVSVMALACAQAMGCNRFILLGQNLALSGEHYYAGGVKADLSKEGYASLGHSDTMVGRTIKLLEIDGWDGETLQTLPDYFSYRQHLSEFAAETSVKEPDTVLINASVGGALIPGFEHKHPKDCLPTDTAKIDKHLPAKEKNSGKQRARILKHTEQLLGGLQKSAVLVQETSQVLSEIHQALIQQRPVNQALETTYKENRKTFSDLLDQYPLVDYFMKKELWAMQEEFCFDPQSPQDFMHNVTVDERYFQNVMRLLDNTLLPWVEQCLARLKASAS